ncbi:hypothetical protein J4G33_01300 [Actinotalea sp. BY-33]|uniref:PH domain-containing protein n=1 Tax=Actinotalea soli TaxID=2819234 RepID=A0A939LQ10_9CELL|nr:hypothetical protein [Actinotalea soli]MBO1750435.1 hypothetical protein [Actinotalea soli]
MTTTQSSIAVLAGLFVVILLAMWWGWHRRGARTGATVPPPPAVPAEADRGALRCPPIEVVYVSSTRAGDWLDRVVAHDLGVRAAATVSVHETGVLLARRGATDVFVPASGVRRVGRAPGIAGKYVGGEGLVVLTWEVPGTADRGPALLDTGLRTRRRADREPLTAALTSLVPVAGTPSTTVAPTEEQP